MRMPRAISITARTALLSWLVSITTLLIFIIAILPLQKRSFLESLQSKARSVSISLREVAAGAAVNEDYSSVVDHCKEMLAGDQSLAYLVITKNDGFSLIHDRNGWRSELNAAKEWRPDKREILAGIGIVPLFNQRVFHYSQPFDYSGIQWGWIHVGISLDSYDRSVEMVYWRIGIIAVICVLLSLAASAIYAKKLVKPILTLRDVVQRVAGGDLSARATNDRSDEIGSLTRSVNSMTEALLRRDRILQSVRFAAQQFLIKANWMDPIAEVLARIGEAAELSRIHVLSNHTDEKGNLWASLRFEWTSPGISPVMDTKRSQFSWHDSGLNACAKALSQGELVTLDVHSPDLILHSLFEQQGVRSLLCIPILVENKWWGALCLEDCKAEREWTEPERDSLRAAADMLGSTIARQQMQDALLDAKRTLEYRVNQRTQELMEQIAAKERAHAALADAQERLVDASHQAGMAEVATGVLHNVGNVLNSINVSTTIVREELQKSEVTSLAKLALLLEKHSANLNDFLLSDPKGRKVPEFIAELSKTLNKENALMRAEHEQLSRNVEHIKEIVAMQQSYAMTSGLLEKVSIVSLVEDALQLNEADQALQGLRVIRHFDDVPPVMVDKHKVMQILINLIQNATHALDESSQASKLLTVEVSAEEGNQVRVQIKDNGVGIPPDNLTRIFSHGFTTRKGGHGFGLHSGAIAARQMGGILRAQSDGVGLGATFTLELPANTDGNFP